METTAVFNRGVKIWGLSHTPNCLRFHQNIFTYFMWVVMTVEGEKTYGSPGLFVAIPLAKAKISPISGLLGKVEQA